MKVSFPDYSSESESECTVVPVQASPVGCVSMQVASSPLFRFECGAILEDLPSGVVVPEPLNTGFDDSMKSGQDSYPFVRALLPPNPSGARPAPVKRIQKFKRRPSLLCNRKSTHRKTVLVDPPTPSKHRLLDSSPIAKGNVPMRRESWLAAGGGGDTHIDLRRVDHDDLQEAALRGDRGLVQRLVAAGASVNAPIRPESDDEFMTLLHMLSRKPEIHNGSAMLRLVLELTANIDARSTIGATPLLYACLGKHVAAVEALLEARADVSCVDDYGRNCVGCAVQTINTNVPKEWSVRILTALSGGGASFESTGLKYVPLLEAIKDKNEIVVESLLHLRAEPDGLLLAASEGSFTLVKMLTEAEANPFVRDSRGLSAMDVALARNEGQISALLRNYIGDLQRKNHRHLLTRVADEAVSHNRPKKTRKSTRTSASTNSFSDTPSSKNKREACLRLLSQTFSTLRSICKTLVTTRIWQFVTLGALLAALLVQDLWVICSISSNEGLDALVSVILVIFVIELAVRLTLSGTKYLWTFTFCMDLLGILTLCLDFSIVSSIRELIDNRVVMQAARMSKLGARAARFTNFVQLISHLPGMKQPRVWTGMVGSISLQLRLSLNLRVSIVLICMVLVVPLEEASKYPTTDGSMRAWVDVIQSTYSEVTSDVSDLVQDMEEFYRGRNYFPYEIHCVDKSGREAQFHLSSGSPPRRPESILRVDATGSTAAYALYNFELVHQNDSIWNLSLICLVIIGLILSSLSMAAIVAKIILVPLEQIMKDMKRVGGAIFSSLATLENSAEKTGDEEWNEYESPVGDDVYRAEILLLEDILARLRVLSDIHANKSRKEVGDLDNLKETDCAMIQLHYDGRVQRQVSGASVFCTEETRFDVSDVFHEAIEQRLAEFGIAQGGFRRLDIAVRKLEVPAQIEASICVLMLNRGSPYDDVINEATTFSQVCIRFVEKVAERHLETNPFHNFAHAVDTCIAAHQLMELCATEHYFSSRERLALVVAALGHDLAHPGVNNTFIVESYHELALLYNDRSPLEHMHCAALFELLVDEGCGLFDDLSTSKYREVRSCIIDAILSTDGERHLSMVTDLSTIYEMNKDLFDISYAMYRLNAGDFPSKEAVELFHVSDVRHQLRNMVLHFADIGFATKPWALCQEWAELWQEELFLQGDEERSRGMPIQPLNDRTKNSLSYAQVCFAEFYVAPLAIVVETMAPPVEILVNSMMGNVDNWVNTWIRSTPTPDKEDQDKVWERIANLELKRRKPM